ncbi:unnamed protein product [Linum trigynum]|uniref:Uncharacterized protein n=1 Tax=Linum trigynum TaxID=586398 RepID=A0AAV2F714_9ROSI
MSPVRRRSGTNRICIQRRETPKTLVYPPTNKEPVAGNPSQKGTTAATVQKGFSLYAGEGDHGARERTRRRRENAPERDHGARERTRRQRENATPGIAKVGRERSFCSLQKEKGFWELR